MNLTEYARYDALGLAGLVKKKRVSAKELAETAARAIEARNGTVNAVVETYGDRIEDLDEKKLRRGPFRGVPFLIKDVGGHEAGRRIEFGSRLCQGMVAQADTHVAELFRAAGLNILGRSNAPEYSIGGSTENALYGNTSTPWRQGYSAGGSTGGGMAAVVAGMVPIAHGSDIGGSIRVPASWCGGVGLKPSRGRVSAGPLRDEGGWGLAMNFVQTMTVRDAAAMLDCLAIPQVGDPFAIPKPKKPYAKLIGETPKPLTIALTTTPVMDAPVDPEVAAAVNVAAQTLSAMGHRVEEIKPDFDGEEAARRMLDVWFFGFDLTLEDYARRMGRTIGPDTLEPITLQIYERSKSVGAKAFLDGIAFMNTARRRLGRVFAEHDVWLTPTTALVAERHGLYNQSLQGVDVKDWIVNADKPLQFCFPHNIMGTPAISLPLAMHSTGLPIGVQLGGRPSEDHVVLQLAAVLEAAMPWRNRIPPLHVSRA
ncbi:MAG: amidase [Alphaproteobacteria bacterium]|nr:amidase [Alphaproteobacteria bacterium]